MIPKFVKVQVDAAELPRHKVRTLMKLRHLCLQMMLEIIQPEATEENQMLLDADHHWDCFGRWDFVNDAKMILKHQRFHNWVNEILDAGGGYNEFRDKLHMDIEIPLGVFLLDQIMRLREEQRAEGATVPAKM